MQGLISLPRAFGHDKVSLLEGGLPRAVHEGVALEEGEPTKYEVG